MFVVSFCLVLPVLGNTGIDTFQRSYIYYWEVYYGQLSVK